MDNSATDTIFTAFLLFGAVPYLTHVFQFTSCIVQIQVISYIFHPPDLHHWRNMQIIEADMAETNMNLKAKMFYKS